MPLYTILATRETEYSFDIEAASEQEAIAEMQRIETEENLENYAYEWFPLEVIEVIEEEELS